MSINQNFDLIKFLESIDITTDDIIKNDLLIRLILSFYDIENLYIDGIDIASPYLDYKNNNNNIYSLTSESGF